MFQNLVLEQCGNCSETAVLLCSGNCTEIGPELLCNYCSFWKHPIIALKLCLGSMCTKMELHLLCNCCEIAVGLELLDNWKLIDDISSSRTAPKLPWHCSETYYNLKTLLNCSETTLEPFWNWYGSSCSRTALELVWSQFGNALELFWSRSGTELSLKMPRNSGAMAVICSETQKEKIVKEEEEEEIVGG